LTPKAACSPPDVPLFQPDEEESRPQDLDGAPQGMKTPLLTAAGERFLFRKFNYLKYHANTLRAKLHRRRPQQRRVEQIERLLREATQTRNLIVQANLRLAAALAGKFAVSRADYEELLSEAHLILVNAVDKFDFSRGYRFSTYATHAIQRHFFRVLRRRQRRKERETGASPELLSSLVRPLEEQPIWNPQAAAELIGRLDDCLDPRERTIVTERFGLAGGAAAETLKQVADRVGLSKERVRQIQLRAIEKLQDLALQIGLRPEACL
jgi:RNA polymerase sigma factor (sigma-70 family)